MQGKHLILLTLCCLWLYVANARVISSVKSTKIRTVKVPACGCKSPVIDVPPCACRGLGFDPTYGCACDLNMRRTCCCPKPVYIDPLEIPLCACGSGLPVATVFTVEMPCGCQSPETCTCGYKNSPILPGIYDFVEVPRCGCQKPVTCGCQPINACGCQPINACGCQPINACGCQSVKACGCPSLNPCGCQGSVWMNYDYVSPYEVSPCRCNNLIPELPCGCQDGICGCRAMQVPNPYDCLGSIIDPCGCVISGISEVPIYTCGCQSTPCGCGGDCGCGCGVTLPPVAPVVGCTKYLRQVKLQPPFL